MRDVIGQYCSHSRWSNVFVLLNTADDFTKSNLLLLGPILFKEQIFHNTCWAGHTSPLLDVSIKKKTWYRRNGANSRHLTFPCFTYPCAPPYHSLKASHSKRGSRCATEITRSLFRRMSCCSSKDMQDQQEKETAMARSVCPHTFGHLTTWLRRSSILKVTLRTMETVTVIAMVTRREVFPCHCPDQWMRLVHYVISDHDWYRSCVKNSVCPWWWSDCSATQCLVWWQCWYIAVRMVTLTFLHSPSITALLLVCGTLII